MEWKYKYIFNFQSKSASWEKSKELLPLGLLFISNHRKKFISRKLEVSFFMQKYNKFHNSIKNSSGTSTWPVFKYIDFKVRFALSFKRTHWAWDHFNSLSLIWLSSEVVPWLDKEWGKHNQALTWSLSWSWALRCSSCRGCTSPSSTWTSIDWMCDWL